MPACLTGLGQVSCVGIACNDVCLAKGRGNGGRDEKTGADASAAAVPLSPPNDTALFILEIKELFFLTGEGVDEALVEEGEGVVEMLLLGENRLSVPVDGDGTGENSPAFRPNPSVIDEVRLTRPITEALSELSELLEGDLFVVLIGEIAIFLCPYKKNYLQ